MKFHIRPLATRAAALALTTMLAVSVSGCASFKPHSPQDAAITQQVQALFAQHTEFQNQLSVQTIDNVVYLNGQAATDLQKETAESLARGVPNVTNVINNIYVNNPR